MFGGRRHGARAFDAAIGSPNLRPPPPFPHLKQDVDSHDHAFHQNEQWGKEFVRKLCKKSPGHMLYMRGPCAPLCAPCAPRLSAPCAPSAVRSLRAHRFGALCAHWLGHFLFRPCAPIVVVPAQPTSPILRPAEVASGTETPRPGPGPPRPNPPRIGPAASYSGP